MSGLSGWRGLTWWYNGVRLSVDGRRCVRGMSPLSRCTRCLDDCPRQAIRLVPHRSTSVPTVDPSCDGCGRCAEICPTGAIVLPDQVAGSRRELLRGWFLRSPHHRREQAAPIRTVQLPSTCDGCGVCAKLCPEGLLFEVADKNGSSPRILRSDRCNGCRLCVDVCTVGQIQILAEAPANAA